MSSLRHTVFGAARVQFVYQRWMHKYLAETILVRRTGQAAGNFKRRIVRSKYWWCYMQWQWLWLMLQY